MLTDVTRGTNEARVRQILATIEQNVYPSQFGDDLLRLVALSRYWLRVFLFLAREKQREVHGFEEMQC